MASPFDISTGSSIIRICYNHCAPHFTNLRIIRYNSRSVHAWLAFFQVQNSSAQWPRSKVMLTLSVILSLHSHNTNLKMLCIILHFIFFNLNVNRAHTKGWNRQTLMLYWLAMNDLVASISLQHKHHMTITMPGFTHISIKRPVFHSDLFLEMV